MHYISPFETTLCNEHIASPASLTDKQTNGQFNFDVTKVLNYINIIWNIICFDLTFKSSSIIQLAEVDEVIENMTFYIGHFTLKFK